MQRRRHYSYNPETLMYEEKMEPKVFPHLRRTALVVGAFALGAFYIWAFTSLYGQELPKTVLLRTKNAAWQAKLENINRQLDLYERTLSGLEERDDHVYRSIYGLNEIPDQVRAGSSSSSSRYDYLDESGASERLKSTVIRMDVLMRRAYVQSKGFDEVSQISSKAGDMLSCVPAIPPMVPDKNVYRLSSTFGYRRDPVWGYTKFHEGIDFAMKPGTPLYATADGTVEKVRYQFFGYGNELIIDHGFGYKTRYAHLSTIDVTAGMKVTRGDKVAESGNSGKSTGPHLHFEVLYKGRPVNPYNYMDLAMNPKEYKSMVEDRLHQTGQTTTRRSSRELLKKRR